MLRWARETEFFALSNSGGWLQPYGKFFLEWCALRSKKLCVPPVHCCKC